MLSLYVGCCSFYSDLLRTLRYQKNISLYNTVVKIIYLLFKVGRGVYFIPGNPGEPSGSSWCLAEPRSGFRMNLKM